MKPDAISVPTHDPEAERISFFERVVLAAGMTLAMFEEEPKKPQEVKS